MDKFENIVRNVITDPILNIECCSRLLHKNVVFHIHTNENEYAVKFFYKGIDIDSRYEKELLIHNFFKKNGILNVCEIVNVSDSICGKVIIMDWIEGQSLKAKLKELGLTSCYNDINNMIADLENIRSIDDIDLRNQLSVDRLGIENRFNSSEKKVLNAIIKNKPNIDFTEIIEIYKTIKNKINPEFNYVINSDISVHEYILTTPKAYWIDFETFKLGNPNNDLARAFQSLTNSIYKNAYEFYNIFLIFKNNKYYDKEIFLYYLTEKLFSTIYTAKDQIDDNEIEFYIKFIKDNFYELKNKNPNIKKHSYFK